MLIKFFIWYTAIYGIAWTLTCSVLTSDMRLYLSNKLYKEDKYEFFYNLFTCIVCTSFWCALILVDFYFPEKSLFEKLLISFSTLTTTWLVANKVGDAS